MSLIRLNKYLASTGVCSRRKADEHTLDGAVSINGIIVRELGTKIDPEKDKIQFKGTDVGQSEKFVYYAINKPCGVISTASDENGRQTVLELVPETPRVYPVGRLDKDSDGLLILTNDGEMTNKLTHPKFEHEKEYIVKARTQKQVVIDPREIENRFVNGISVDGKIMKADTVSASMIRNNRYDIWVTIHTGYNRQVRKMCAKMGLEVVGLTRTRIGKLTLSSLGLTSGQYIEIKKEDLV